jgi:very-long-chain (3R)-3-hydroxyacyl-CoA dehydratase
MCRYVAKQMGRDVYALCWLRYTAFIVLYPVGLFAELYCMWLALPLVKASGRLSFSMPNPLNMAFDYPTCLHALLIIQPLGWLLLYKGLLKHRARFLTREQRQVSMSTERYRRFGVQGSGGDTLIAG